MTRLEEENTSLKVQWSWFGDYRSRFINNYFKEMCSGSEASSYLRLIDFVHHLDRGLRIIKKKKKQKESTVQRMSSSCDGT